MNFRGTPQSKNSLVFSPHGRSPTWTSPAKQGKAATTITTATSPQPPSCCGGFNDCMTMGSTFSNHQRHQSTLKLEQQVAELEKEVQKQKEVKAMYRLRLERTQDYLRYCLQVAKDNEFLDIIIHGNNINNNIKDQRQHQHQHGLSRSPSEDIVHATTINPLTPPPVSHHHDLVAVIDQAKMNGWYIEPNEIALHEKVGQGSTADIYRATWRGLEVAVKCINPDFFNSNESGLSFFAQEVETLSRQRHRFVLQLLGASLDPPDYGWIVTEFLGMTLKDWLHGHGGRKRERVVPLPCFGERVNKALEIAQAMQYLHEQKPKLIHRDLKPSNVFLDDALHVRVADFGHARFLSEGEKALTGETGTYVYMAPEVIRCEPYNEKCDVYSFAVILNELITGEYPYIETDYGPSKIALEVAEGRLRPAVPENNEQNIEELIDLMQLSWDEDASIRPSFATITCSLRNIQKRLFEST